MRNAELLILDCRLRISDLKSEIYNPKSEMEEIRNPKSEFEEAVWGK